MRSNTVKQMWREGKVAVGGWCQIGSSFSAELMANLGFDWLCIDTQHGQIDYSTAFPMLQAISTTPTVPIVRVPWNEPSIIMKYLDAGAMGIIVPMISTAADAEAAVRATRYPPEGIRSYGPVRSAVWSGSGDPAEHNREVALILMIETAEALENLEAIASVPGVDALYIGPSDLNQALGQPPRQSPFESPHRETVLHIKDVCEAHGVVAGVHTWGAQYASQWVKEGFKFVMLTSDVLTMTAQLRLELGILRETINEVEGIERS